MPHQFDIYGPVYRPLAAKAGWSWLSPDVQDRRLLEAVKAYNGIGKYEPLDASDLIPNLMRRVINEFEREATAKGETRQ